MSKILTFEGIKVPIGSHKGKLIVLGADHRGFKFKNELEYHLEMAGYEVVDVGTLSPERCDYPSFSDAIGRLVSEDPYTSVGIGICGSGIGILIPASKHKGVYAARCLSPEESESSRMHNNTNVLGIGADCMNLETALDTVDAWLTTPFFSDIEKEEQYLMRFVQTVKLETAVR